MHNPKKLLDICMYNIIRCHRFLYGPSLYEFKYYLPNTLFLFLLRGHMNMCRWVYYVYVTFRYCDNTPYCYSCITKRKDQSCPITYQTSGPFLYNVEFVMLRCRACGKNIVKMRVHEK